MKIMDVVVWKSFSAQSLGLGSDAEPGAAPDRGRHPGFARHHALAVTLAGELGRSVANTYQPGACR